MLPGIAVPATGQAGGQPAAAPAYSVDAKILHPDDVVRFSAPGLAAIASKIKCGPDGDIYAIYSGNSASELSSSPVRRISPSSHRVTEYSIPAIPGYEKLARLSFDVGSDGTLYMLVQAQGRSASQSDSVKKYAYLIVKYKDDGSIDSWFPLADIPGKQIQPTSLDMFADGNSLVSGTAREKATSGEPMGVFSAVFDQTGALRTPVTLMKLAAPAGSAGSPGAHGSASTAEPQGALSLASSLLSFSSPDGNVYVLEDDELEVVSQAGSIERRIKLPPPNKDVSPLQMAAAGAGYLFVFYDHIATGAPGENTQRRSMITVANSEGDVTALYRLSPTGTDFAVAACAVSMNDFVFLSTDEQNHLEVVHYRPD